MEKESYGSETRGGSTGKAANPQGSPVSGERYNAKFGEQNSARNLPPGLNKMPANGGWPMNPGAKSSHEAPNQQHDNNPG